MKNILQKTVLICILLITTPLFAQLNNNLSTLQQVDYEISNSIDAQKSYSSSSKEVRKFNPKGKKISFPLKVSLMIATFATSMTTAYLGFDYNTKANEAYDKYRYSREPDDIKKFKQQVTDYESKRNMYYTISGVVGAGFVATIFVF